jgi:hypothetical protein
MNLDEIRQWNEEMKQEVEAGRRGIRGIGIAPIASGVAFVAGIVVTILLLVQAGESSGWPSTPGKIIESRVEQQRSGGGRQLSLDGPVQEGAVYTWAAEIRYEYSVEGKDHVGSRIQLDDMDTNDRSRAEGIAAGYPVGKEVDVYYDPDKPEIAVLVPGTMGLVVLMAVGSLIPLVMTFLFLYAGRKNRRKDLEAIHVEVSKQAIRTALERSRIDPYAFWEDDTTPISDPEKAATVARALRRLVPDDPEEARWYFQGSVPEELWGEFDRAAGPATGG